MSITVDYFLSTSSPWTYLASKRFTDMASKAGATVNVYPSNFGAVFAVSGGLPLPKRAPQRQAYRMMELKRWKKRLSSPIILEPANFPSTAPISSHTIIAAREAGEDALELSNQILAALWEEDSNIDDPSVIEEICYACGMDGAALVAAANEPAIAQKFEVDTKLAIDRGVFGAPSYIINDEIFWGQDRLEFVAEALGVG
ncbi:MAG: 2-hydroxychromene-2-carboxylate isomerase [Rhodospirillaceae bacterium]|jgi:2-hydroxychromene-2-carboxylate isomerase|nr:2-hydroxychromene-2-carboxylate isomerase [Rhodospirillaceae bacterium]MBT6138135.1 2-hydroxychromene-2-carboxylate isomerase [Rhodospirillaceae bacterium]